MAKLQFDRPTNYLVAAITDCDVRAVERFSRGEPVRGRVGERIAKVVSDLERSSRSPLEAFRSTRSGRNLSISSR